jgi:GT2 family glycosyltransferase
LYRRSALIELGGFDEDYFCYVEDVDLGFRLRLAGHQCLYIPSSIVHHVGSGSTGGKNSDFAVYHGHRNLVWTYVKDMPGFLFWLFLIPSLFLIPLIFTLLKATSKALNNCPKEVEIKEIKNDLGEIQGTKVVLNLPIQYIK